MAILGFQRAVYNIDGLSPPRVNLHKEQRLLGKKWSEGERVLYPSLIWGDRLAGGGV